MGKDLNGRELGVGLLQRKDGRYSARLTDLDGKRVEKNFEKLKDAKDWLYQANFIRGNGEMVQNDMTYDEWFIFWKNNILRNTVKPSTFVSYERQYRISIQKEIGNMKLRLIKPFHCQMVLNKCVDKGHSTKSIGLVRNVMSVSLQSACENGIIKLNPVNSSVHAQTFTLEKKKYLTLEEHKIFVDYITDVIDYYYNATIYDAFLLILQTGLRIGELMALSWVDLDFENRRIVVRHSMSQYQYRATEYSIGSCKTKSGHRVIPMTDTAYDILKSMPIVEAKDDKFAGLIFLNPKNGNPYHVGTYKDALSTIFKNIPVEHISIHGLRHTFATRCIENGMTPKILQVILGHNSIQVTMDLYVHMNENVTREELNRVAKCMP